MKLTEFLEKIYWLYKENVSYTHRGIRNKKVQLAGHLRANDGWKSSFVVDHTQVKPNC